MPEVGARSPVIILIVVVSVIGPGMVQIICILGLLLGIGGSRIVRGTVVSVRENMYVHAAQSMGASTMRILWRHVIPTALPAIAESLGADAKLAERAAQLSKADLLTDMVGGTPANIATHLVRAGSIEGVAGVNLPMLMRTLTYRCNPLATVVAKAVSGGTECVATLARGEHRAAG